MSPGDCIGVDAYFRTVRHLGIVTDAVGQDGRFRVVSASNRLRGVREEDFADFCHGKEAYPVLWFSGYSVEETLSRARDRIGTPYNHTQYNCEHFVKECFGLAGGSPQSRRVGYVAAAAGAAAAGLAVFWGSRT